MLAEGQIVFEWLLDGKIGCTVYRIQHFPFRLQKPSLSRASEKKQVYIREITLNLSSLLTRQSWQEVQEVKNRFTQRHPSLATKIEAGLA